MQVIKRDGRNVPFDEKKIENAILKAFEEVDNGINSAAKAKAKEISLYILGLDKLLNVEDIQDLVEEKLMSSKRKDVARAYIIYRNERTKARKAESYKTFNSIINAESNDITKENANMNAETPAGMMMKFASETTKQYVNDCLLSEEAAEAYRGNYIHPHDMDYYPTKSLTCLQHPLDKILTEGFRAGHGSSRPSKRIETASFMGCISMETVQNEMHGGQSIPAFDFYLAPYVRKTYIEEIKKLEDYDGVDYSHYYTYEIADFVNDDSIIGNYPKQVKKAIKETVKRVHQSMEAFIHNMNTIHSRGGNQVVFSSINYGTDTSPEGRCVIREILKSTIKGVGNGETPIFPIQIWKHKIGASSHNPNDKNYDLFKLSCEATAKRFFPNFLFLDAPFNKDDSWNENDIKRYLHEVATMGCRTRVFENRHGDRTSVGRGNLSFTSINIVKLALECREIEDIDLRISTFYQKLDKYIDIVARQLYERYKFQCTALKTQFPLLMNGLWTGSDELSANDTVESVLKQGTLGIGFIGLAETLIALIGKHHGESSDAQNLGLEIVGHMKERVSKHAENYDLNFSLLATPAEGLSGKFTKKDKQTFGIIENITDKEYYTNSNHVPVWYHCSVKHKVEIEAPYHALTLGGHIFYVEVDGDTTHNPESIESIVKIMSENNVGYGSINHLRNRCLDCGYESAVRNLSECLNCNSENIDTIERITGYLVGSVGSWNASKKAELEDRVTHD